MSEEPAVSDAVARSRYELRLEDTGAGTVAGYAEYRRDGDTTAFVHTLVEDSYGGRGFGSILIRGALDAERAAGRTVVAHCPFVRGFIEKHPEYQDLVSQEEQSGPRPTRTRGNEPGSGTRT